MSHKAISNKKARAHSAFPNLVARSTAAMGATAVFVRKQYERVRKHELAYRGIGCMEVEPFGEVWPTFQFTRNRATWFATAFEGPVEILDLSLYPFDAEEADPNESDRDKWCRKEYGKTGREFLSGDTYAAYRKAMGAWQDVVNPYYESGVLLGNPLSELLPPVPEQGVEIVDGAFLQKQVGEGYKGIGRTLNLDRDVWHDFTHGGFIYPLTKPTLAPAERNTDLDTLAERVREMAVAR
jgi:hypothetical protein